MQKVYRSQGVIIHDKHLEVIISKMLSKVQVIRSGDTEFLPGDLVDRLIFTEVNAQAASTGKEPASAKPVLLGIPKAALNTDSFLSASSFQHTIKVLAGAAIEGKQDELKGLKENVIIGKLIPAGTGFWETHEELLPETAVGDESQRTDLEMDPEDVGRTAGEIETELRGLLLATPSTEDGPEDLGDLSG